MKHTWKGSLVFSLCLATLLLAVGTPLTSHAATQTARLPHDLAACYPKVPADTGISYDADESYSYPITASTQIGIFSYHASSNSSASNPWPYSPKIGAWVCQSGDIVLFVDSGAADWFNLTESGDDWAMVVNHSGYTVDPAHNWITIDLGVLPASLTKQYILTAQACYYDDEEGTTACSRWSPSIELTVASNSFCQNGYIWREAAPFDHVCVQPWEADQAAYDNNQNRIVNSPWPYRCAYGYVWRQAWGGDYTCVDPPQRDQVASDNSQALNRIVAL